MKIPVTVIIATRNEEQRIRACVKALEDFDEIIVFDSASSDRTQHIAAECGARVENFEWNGRYPKKRQWGLENLALKHDWVFWVDADEIVTPELIEEIRVLDWSAAGYFVKGRYVFDGKMLRHGLANNKLALFDRRKIEFPVVDDLDIPGMGEMEGHYQPVLKKEFGHGKIGCLTHSLIHDAYNENWHARHERYAAWEVGMNQQGAWPQENSPARRILKTLFRAMPMRPLIAFTHCYIFKLGFLDGGRGFKFARSRAVYYRMILNASKAREPHAAPSIRTLAADK